jgi:pyruvate formate lyase activating enzyme
MNGFISKIQRYSTRDGPGIRSTVFSAGCNLRCKWCSNPELMEGKQKLFYHEERCKGCGNCVPISGGAIQIENGKCIIDRDKYFSFDECAAACFYDAYELTGESICADELAAKLLKDKVFYDQSGGGVTYSGGEPALQADFFLETSKLLKKESVHIALDTAGFIPWRILEPLVKAVDLVLYDIKMFDNALHKQYTDVENMLILENAHRIADMKKTLIIRMILVPGVNDTDEEINSRLAFIRSLGSAVLRLDIIKYHRLAAGKYLRLGLPLPMEDTPECTDETAYQVVQKAIDMGIEANIG